MAKKVLIIGESGTGKSASLRNFDASEVLLINVAGKDLPFRSKGWEIVSTDNYRTVKQAMAKTNKKVIVIDDVQYLMANEFMRRASEKGFDKFTEIGQNFWDLQQAINALPSDVIVYELSHLDRDQNGNEKVKTIGKLLDEKITVEGMFTIVLKTTVNDGNYQFQTQNSGHDTCKAPIGLFNNMFIDNDLKAVDSAIREYYGDEPAPVNVEEPAKVEEPKEAPKTLAEKVADFKNNNPVEEKPATTAAPVETADATPRRRRRV